MKQIVLMLINDTPTRYHYLFTDDDLNALIWLGLVDDIRNFTTYEPNWHRPLGPAVISYQTKNQTIYATGYYHHNKRIKILNANGQEDALIRFRR